MESINKGHRMGKFLEIERDRQAAYKAQSAYFSDAAKSEGTYRKKPRTFCVPRSLAEENLFVEIRDPVMEYFSKYEIKWHDGQEGKPSNHLCDSMVCCANFLFPFANNPNALAELLRPNFPEILKVLPMEKDGQYLSCEWIGLENYLKEKLPRHGKRTRGALFTSADAAVLFERKDGRKQIVLIEWKYTESYSSSFTKFSKSGTDRSQIYAHIFNREDCPLDKNLLPNYDAVFYDPFDQLFRQQLLAHEMERHHEFEADIVSVLHIAPEHNADFRRVTSDDLKILGDVAVEVWEKLVQPPDRFIHVATEGLFSKFPIADFPELANWREYITTRYAWVN